MIVVVVCLRHFFKKHHQAASFEIRDLTRCFRIVRPHWKLIIRFYEQGRSTVQLAKGMYKEKGGEKGVKRAAAPLGLQPHSDGATPDRQSDQLVEASGRRPTGLTSPSSSRAPSSTLLIYSLSTPFSLARALTRSISFPMNSPFIFSPF